ncbi:hypothetical protein TNCV_4320161 [Trichonephila clavipes]|nr:hypothetical protein TNCV_4320161 [Trichonephila clavipes]
MSTNKETPSRKQANQHQAPNTLSMGRRNASRSSAQRCQATDEGERILERTWLVSPRCDVVFDTNRLRGKRSAMLDYI